MQLKGQAKTQSGLAGLQSKTMASLTDLEAKRNFYNQLFGGATTMGSNSPMQFGNLMGILATIRQNKRNSDAASGGGGLFGLF
jgi:hypothetical protein